MVAQYHPFLKFNIELKLTISCSSLNKTRYKPIMIDENDFLRKQKANRSFRKVFKATCNSCGCDRGYVDKSDANKLCRSCTRIHVHKVMDPEIKKRLSQNATIQFTGHTPWNKGKTGIYSDELKQQWSEKHTELMSIEENRDLSGTGPRNSWLKGKEVPLHLKINLSCKHRGIPVEEFDEFKHIDKNQDRRKFGYLKFSQQCFERDNYACQLCKTKGAHLHAHHKNGFDKFPDQRFELSNLVTLCKPCHDSFHTEFGKGNNTEEQFEQFKVTKIKKPLTILTGAPASGKSWVAKQLSSFDVIDSDVVRKKDLVSRCEAVSRPLLTLTVGVSTFIKNNPQFDVQLIVIQESQQVVEQRMALRNGKITDTIKRRIKRMESLAKKAIFAGTSDQVFNFLK